MLCVGEKNVKIDRPMSFGVRVTLSYVRLFVRCDSLFNFTKCVFVSPL